jgi:hypothetical protein
MDLTKDFGSYFSGVLLECVPYLFKLRSSSPLVDSFLKLCHDEDKGRPGDLKRLIELLKVCYNSETILLIDEFDTPLYQGASRGDSDFEIVSIH